MKITIFAGFLLIFGVGAGAPQAHADRLERDFTPVYTLPDGVVLERTGVARLTVGYIFRVYTAALYRIPDHNPKDVLADEPRRLEIRYLRKISREQLISAGDDLLGQMHPPATLTSIQKELNTINAWYQDVGPGDRYALTYIPGTGTELSLNGTALGTVPGADFARIYFSIWLGTPHPYPAFRDTLTQSRPKP